MSNNYKAAEIVEVDTARNMILGAKMFGDPDSEMDLRPQILVQDDDE